MSTSAAIGDVALALQSVPATYDTFTEPYTGTSPQRLAINLQIKVTNTSNLADDVVVVPVDCNFGHSEAGLTAARYFSFASASFGGTVINSVTLSPGSGSNPDKVLLHLKASVNVGTVESVTLYFDYNSQYDEEGKRVAPDTILWPAVTAYTADITDLDTSVEAVVGANSIKTSAHDQKTVTLSPLTPTSLTGATEDSMIHLRFRANNDYQYESSLDFTKINRFTVTMPSTLTDSLATPWAVALTSGNTVGTTSTSNWTGYTNNGTHHLLTKDFIGNGFDANGGWTNYNDNSVRETGTFFQRDITIRIPAGVAPGTYPVTLTYEYYYVGDPTPHTSTETYTYTINALSAYEMTYRNTHTTDSPDLSQSGWEATNTCSTNVNALGGNDYGNSITGKNIGIAPIKQVKFTYYNSNHGVNKLNYDTISIGATREFSDGQYGSYKIGKKNKAGKDDGQQYYK